MLCAWFEDGLASVKRNVPIPVPGSGEALVKVVLSGICSTDVELLAGYYKYRGVPGHELVGLVASVGPGIDEGWLDTRVVVSINESCLHSSCSACSTKRQHHCPKRRVIGIHEADGAHAEYVLVKLEQLVQVPDSIPDEQAVFCEPLAAALRIAQQVHVAGKRVLLIGAGKLGQLIARAMLIRGAIVTVLTKYPAQTTLLRLLSRITVLEQEPIPGSEEWPIVIEATGSASGMEAALKLVEAEGTIVLKSTFAKRGAWVDLSSLVVKEVNVVGSRCGDMKEAIQALQSLPLDLAPLVSKQLDISDFESAMEYAQTKGTMKVLISYPKS